MQAGMKNWGTEAVIEELQRASAALDSSTYAQMLRACSNEKSVQHGKLVHGHIRAHSDDRDMFLGNRLIQMYARCKSPGEAKQVFDAIRNRNSFTWSLLLECYVRNRMYVEALDLYNDMVKLGGEIEIDEYTISSVLTACNRTGDVKRGRLLHRKAKELGLETDAFIATALINLYSKCSCLDEAEAVFQTMESSNIFDTAVATAMIGAYADREQGDKAIKVYWKMRAQGLEPDSLTYAAVLGACSGPEHLLDGRHIHKHFLRSKDSQNIHVSNALISMYAKCGTIKEAEDLFAMMPSKDVVTWNSMIAAYTAHGWKRDAFRTFRRMVALGHTPDIYTYSSILPVCTDPSKLDDYKKFHFWISKRGFDKDVGLQNSLISMYARCGRLVDAEKFFNNIQPKKLGAWNSMMAAYAQFDEGKQALLLFRSILIEGLRPDRFTFSSVADSCASLGAFREGRLIHDCSTASGFDQDVILSTALLNMYARCGSLQQAWHVFEGITNKDVVSWSAMIAANAQHGHGELSLELSHMMNLDGVAQNEFTSSSVLHGCSHAGLLSEGIEYFTSLKDDFGIGIDEESCVGFLDLLGRAGWLKEAEHVLNTMPFDESFVALVTLLAACKVHGDVKRARSLTRRVVRLQPENAGSYMLLQNLYAAAGRWEDVHKLRRYMKKRGVKKQCGCSWIEHRGRVYEFKVNDSENARNAEIRAELEVLYERMKREEGYVCDTSEVFYDVSDEEKEEMVKFHSEKMAMGFGLISSSAGCALRIVKNLRVCSDCHTVGKLVAKLTGREIVVRDGNRFHHFKDGACSCGDYW